MAPREPAGRLSIRVEGANRIEELTAKLKEAGHG